MSHTAKRRSRREVLAIFGGAIVTTGCGSGSVGDEVIEAIESSPTSELQGTKLALRGYAIVSMTLGQRVFFLPYPGMRILGVTLVLSAVAARIAVTYIDDELVMRKMEEDLTDEERAAIESDGFVRFETESGLEEKQYLGPVVYE